MKTLVVKFDTDEQAEKFFHAFTNSMSNPGSEKAIDQLMFESGIYNVSTKIGVDSYEINVD